ncbi:MAG: substrate-binding domain-containing protein, partial [Clostridia bacterium]
MNVTKLGAVMLAACLLCAAPAMASELNIGLCIYDGTDTFMSSMRNQIEQNAQGVINLTVYNSKNDQNLQNDQVEQLLTSGVDAMILNPVDRTAAGYLIEKAK